MQVEMFFFFFILLLIEQNTNLPAKKLNKYEILKKKHKITFTAYVTLSCKRQKKSI